MAWVRRAGILLTVLVVALGLDGAAAGAKKKHKKKGKAWASRLTRVVTLFYTDPNNGQTSPLFVQRTDGKGKYQMVLTKDAFPGTYHAEVSQRKIRAMKAPQTCKAAQTPAIFIQ